SRRRHTRFSRDWSSDVCSSDLAPSWDGLWTGVHPMDACVTNERMFVMSKDSYSRNELYEVDPELKFDRTQEGHRRQIQGTVYTKIGRASCREREEISRGAEE